jgi:hypothetical protein
VSAAPDSAKPAIAETVNGPPDSQAGELRTRTLHEDDHAFQGLAVYAGDPFRWVGFLLSRGRDGLGLFPNQKAGADAVTVKAVRP